MNSFIQNFSEDEYLKFLNNESSLNTLFLLFNERYNETVKGNIILFFESLNNYVADKIKQNKNFINTIQFQKFQKILRNNISLYTIAFLKNTLLSNLKLEEIKQIFDDDIVNMLISCSSEDLKRKQAIGAKIENNEQITQVELNYMCNSFAFNRKKDNKGHEMLIKYIFNNLTKESSNLRCNGIVLDAIMSYIPKNYPSIDGFDPSTVRIIANDYKNGPGVSYGNFVYMNRSFFKNINFKKHDNIAADYLKRGNDFTFLMIVANHELTHNYQQYMTTKQEISGSGLSMIKRIVLDQNLQDYQENHDNDDIEIDATEKGWFVCSDFYKRIITDQKLAKSLSDQCLKNAITTRNRRYFNVKYDKLFKCYDDTYLYDIRNLDRIMLSKKGEGYLKMFPSLKYFYFNSQRNYQFLKLKEICDNPVSKEFIIERTIDFPRSVYSQLLNLDNQELEVACNNLYNSFKFLCSNITGFYDRNYYSEYKKYWQYNDEEIMKHHQKKLAEFTKILQVIFTKLSENRSVNLTAYMDGVNKRHY